MCPEEATELVTAMEGTSCEEWLRALGLSSLERRRLIGGLLDLLQLPGEGEREMLSSAPWYPVTGHVGMHQERFRLDIRKHCFDKRVVKHCKRFPGEMVDAPSLSVDNALNNNS